MISIYWGNPGCGKTTLAVKKLIRNQKYYKYCLGNFFHTVCGAYRFSVDDNNILGKVSPRFGSYLALDEAGIEFNNRAYKSLPKETIKWLKLHRHFGVDCDVFSQSFEDMDVTIRRLAVEYWYMYRIGPWTLCRRVYKTTMVDKTTHQIIDGYRMASVLWLLVFPLQYTKLIDWKFTLTFRPFYYKHFDSYSREELPDLNAELIINNQTSFVDNVKKHLITLRDKVIKWLRFK